MASRLVATPGEALAKQIRATRIRAAISGRSYDEQLAAEVEAGNQRVLKAAARRRRQVRRWYLQTHVRRPEKPQAPPPRRGTTRMRRSRRAASGASRRGPPSSDPPKSEPPLPRPLTRAERRLLKFEVDRAVREGLEAQAVRDRALFRAVEAWSEAEVVR